nr:MBL fold metallo-hydrolase [Chitinivorax tropicus]
MRFASLGSGSEGNGLIVECKQTRILLDCGFGLRDTLQRLARLHLTPTCLSAIIVTHEHRDHLQGVARLAAKFRIPVYASFGTFNAATTMAQAIPLIQPYDSHDTIDIDDLHIMPFPVPHDAREPTQHVFTDGQHRLGVLTDVGHITPLIEAKLTGCDALVLECNHDLQMLMDGPYPYPLKQRVAGRLGHLSNEQTAGLIRAIDTNSLQHVVAAHLSQKNNLPTLASAALSEALNCERDWIGIATQVDGFSWREIS